MKKSTKKRGRPRGPEKTPITTLLRVETASLLRAHANSTRIPITEHVERALEAYLARAIEMARVVAD